MKEYLTCVISPLPTSWPFLGILHTERTIFTDIKARIYVRSSKMSCISNGGIFLHIHCKDSYDLERFMSKKKKDLPALTVLHDFWSSSPWRRASTQSTLKLYKPYILSRRSAVSNVRPCFNVMSSQCTCCHGAAVRQNTINSGRVFVGNLFRLRKRETSIRRFFSNPLHLFTLFCFFSFLKGIWIKNVKCIDEMFVTS